MKTILVAAIAAITICAPAQSVKVKIKSNGDDIRRVIATMFDQANQQYVMETGVRQSLYMSVENISFERAVEIVSNVADLTFTKREGVWFINTRKVTKSTPAPQPTKVETSGHKFGPIPEPTTSTKKTPPNSKGKEVIPATKTVPVAKPIPTEPIGTPKSKTPSAKSVDLTKRVTTKMQKTDIREVFSQFAKQAGVEIEVMDSVPDYKIDAFMFNTSLKFALDRVCAAAKLKYEITPGKTVRISKA